MGILSLRLLPMLSCAGSLVDLSLEIATDVGPFRLQNLVTALYPLKRLTTLKLCGFDALLHDDMSGGIDSSRTLQSIRTLTLNDSVAYDVIPFCPNVSSLVINPTSNHYRGIITSDIHAHAPWPASIREISYDPWLQLLVTGSKADYARPVSRLDLEGTIMVAPLTMDIRAPRRYEPLGNIDHIRPLSISMHVNADSETEDHPRNASPFWKELGMQVSPPLRALRLQISPRLLGDVATEDQLLLLVRPVPPWSGLHSH